MPRLALLALLIIVGFIGAATPTRADDTRLGDLVVTNAWARPSVGPTGAAYLTIRNEGTTAHRLLGVKSGAAAKVELHETKIENDIMRMRPVEAIEILPGGSVALAPGGMHVMLMGLDEKLVEGGMLPLTLDFAEAGRLEIVAPVRKDAGEMPHGSGHDKPN